MLAGRAAQLENVSLLDAEIAVLETQLTAIKERRNSLASLLLQIPDELIGRILLQVEKDLFRVGLAGNWPQLMVTCRKIRKVALETPELWSQFAFTQDYDEEMTNKISSHFRYTRPKLHRKSWMSLCYARGKSAQVGLHIDREKGATEWPSTLDLTRLAPRTRNLYLNFPDDRDELLRKLFTEQQWPHLTGLELTLYTPMNKTSITSKLLGHCSTLTNLHLYQSKWMLRGERDGSWTFETLPHLPHLRHLTLEGVVFTHREIQLFECLSECSELVSLDINCLPSTCEPLPTTLKSRLPLSLPCLSSVALCGGTNILSCIMSMLPDPLNCLSLRCHHYGQDLMGADMRNLKDRVLKYMRIAHEKFRNDKGYTLRLTAEHPTYEVPGVFIITSSPELGPKRRLLTFSGYCAQTDLFDFMRAADTVTFAAEAHTYAEGAFASLASAQPNIYRLCFREWERTWKMKPAAIAHLEKYLRTRKQQGHRLKVLEADPESRKADPRNLDLEASWLDEELLVDQILIDRMECYTSSDLPGRDDNAP